MNWFPTLERALPSQPTGLHREPVLVPMRPSARPLPVRTPEAEQLVRGLMRPEAEIAPKYLYDDVGSELFETITELPEYYLTRLEHEVMAEHEREIAGAIGRCGSLVDLGAGNCGKTLRLARLLDPEHLVAVDISADTLTDGARVLQAGVPWAQVHRMVADLTQPFVLPAALPVEGRVLSYLGSSIGNFVPRGARALLGRLRRMVDDSGALLIGIDLVKDPALIEAAYDDAIGVTAMFNRNVLLHVNRLIGADFETDDWEHVARWDATRQRIEMSLEARRDLRIDWPGGQRRFRLGERIHTENSYKYRLDRFESLLRHAGWSRTTAWTDGKRGYAVVLARP